MHPLKEKRRRMDYPGSQLSRVDGGGWLINHALAVQTVLTYIPTYLGMYLGRYPATRDGDLGAYLFG